MGEDDVLDVGRDLGAPRAGPRTWARALRVHQWSKNLLVFVPPLLSVPILTLSDVLGAILAFVALCALASATYIVNDMADVAHDRQHSSKKARPFASGAISMAQGAVAAGLLLATSVGLALLLPSQAAFTLLVYATVSLAYSFQLKRVPLLDVICLGFLFTVRIAVGASLLPNSSPYWLYAFSMFFFTSLAFVKRYTELSRAIEEDRTSIPGRSYEPRDLPLVLAAGLGAALCSVVIFLIYLGARHFDERLFRNPGWLGLGVGALAYWLLRTWLLALRDQMHDDPVEFALKDRASWGLGLIVGVALFLAW